MEELEPMSDLEKSLKDIDISTLPDDFDVLGGDEDITDDDFDIVNDTDTYDDDVTDDEDDSTDDDEIDIDYLKPDEFTDKALAKKYIKSCLSDARDEIRHLLSFLRHSPYGMSEGKEEFKKYIERAEQIYNEINSFLKH